MGTATAGARVGPRQGGSGSGRHSEGDGGEQGARAGAASPGVPGAGGCDQGHRVDHRCGVGKVLQGVSERGWQGPGELVDVTSERGGVGARQGLREGVQLRDDGVGVDAGADGDQSRGLVPEVGDGQGGSGRGGSREDDRRQRGARGRALAVVALWPSSRVRWSVVTACAVLRGAFSDPVRTVLRAAEAGFPAAVSSAHRSATEASPVAATAAAATGSPVVTAATATSSAKRAVTKASKSTSSAVTTPVSRLPSGLADAVELLVDHRVAQGARRHEVQLVGDPAFARGAHRAGAHPGGAPHVPAVLHEVRERRACTAFRVRRTGPGDQAVEPVLRRIPGVQHRHEPRRRGCTQHDLEGLDGQRSRTVRVHQHRGHRGEPLPAVPREERGEHPVPDQRQLVGERPVQGSVAVADGG